MDEYRYIDYIPNLNWDWDENQYIYPYPILNSYFPKIKQKITLQRVVLCIICSHPIYSKTKGVNVGKIKLCQIKDPFDPYKFICVCGSCYLLEKKRKCSCYKKNKIICLYCQIKKLNLFIKDRQLLYKQLPFPLLVKNIIFDYLIIKKAYWIPTNINDILNSD